MAEVLGADLLQEVNALVSPSMADTGADGIQRREALVELMIGIIVDVIRNDSPPMEFASRLDNCAEMLRSAGMARARAAHN